MIYAELLSDHSHPLFTLVCQRSCSQLRTPTLIAHPSSQAMVRESSNLAESGALPLLSSFLSHPDPLVSSLAAIACSAINSVGNPIPSITAPMISTLMQAGDPHIRENVSVVVNKMSLEQHSVLHLAQTGLALSKVVDLARSTFGGTRRNALLSLYRISHFLTTYIAEKRTKLEEEMNRSDSELPKGRIERDKELERVKAEKKAFDEILEYITVDKSIIELLVSLVVSEELPTDAPLVLQQGRAYQREYVRNNQLLALGTLTNLSSIRENCDHFSEQSILVTLLRLLQGDPSQGHDDELERMREEAKMKEAAEAAERQESAATLDEKTREEIVNFESFQAELKQKEEARDQALSFTLFKAFAMRCLANICPLPSTHAPLVKANGLSVLLVIARAEPSTFTHPHKAWSPSDQFGAEEESGLVERTGVPDHVILNFSSTAVGAGVTVVRPHPLLEMTPEAFISLAQDTLSRLCSAGVADMSGSFASNPDATPTAPEEDEAGARMSVSVVSMKSSRVSTAAQSTRGKADSANQTLSLADLQSMVETATTSNADMARWLMTKVCNVTSLESFDLGPSSPPTALMDALIQMLRTTDIYSFHFTLVSLVNLVMKTKDISVLRGGDIKSIMTAFGYALGTKEPNIQVLVLFALNRILTVERYCVLLIDLDRGSTLQSLADTAYAEDLRVLELVCACLDHMMALHRPIMLRTVTTILPVLAYLGLHQDPHIALSASRSFCRFLDAKPNVVLLMSITIEAVKMLVNLLSSEDQNLRVLSFRTLVAISAKPEFLPCVIKYEGMKTFIRMVFEGVDEVSEEEEMQESIEAELRRERQELLAKAEREGALEKELEDDFYSDRKFADFKDDNADSKTIFILRACV